MSPCSRFSSFKHPGRVFESQLRALLRSYHHTSLQSTALCSRKISSKSSWSTTCPKVKSKKNPNFLSVGIHKKQNIKRTPLWRKTDRSGLLIPFYSKYPYTIKWKGTKMRRKKKRRTKKKFNYFVNELKRRGITLNKNVSENLFLFSIV